MKKRILKEVRVCEAEGCGGDCNPFPCLRCGADFCNKHKPEHGRLYAPDARDGGVKYLFYCTPCDVRLCESNGDPLHDALTGIRLLREEREAYHRKQAGQAKTLEAEVQRHLPDECKFGRRL